jgi:predicted RNase H-like HicB family nuclease
MFQSDCSFRFEVPVNFEIVVHEAEEGGYWVEVLTIPGCATQGETFVEFAEESLRSD